MDYLKPGHYLGGKYLGQGKPPKASGVGDTIVGAIFDGKARSRWMTDQEYSDFLSEAPARQKALRRSIKGIVLAMFR